MATVVRNTIDPKDPWHLAATNYSLDDVYVRSTDGRGNYETLRNIKVSPALHAALSEALARGDLPDYRTVADLVRDALLHRLHYIQNGNHQIASVVNHEIVASQVATRIARNQQRADMVRMYSEQLAQFEQDEDWASIIDAVDAMSVLVDEWDDTRHGPELARTLNRYATTAARRLEDTKLRAV